MDYWSIVVVIRLFVGYLFILFLNCGRGRFCGLEILWFCGAIRPSLGQCLRRLPLLGEVIVRVLGYDLITVMQICHKSHESPNSISLSPIPRWRIYISCFRSWFTSPYLFRQSSLALLRCQDTSISSNLIVIDNSTHHITCTHWHLKFTNASSQNPSDAENSQVSARPLTVHQTWSLTYPYHSIRLHKFLNHTPWNPELASDFGRWALLFESLSATASFFAELVLCKYFVCLHV
jgi:hypothetical protein